MVSSVENPSSVLEAHHAASGRSVDPIQKYVDCVLVIIALDDRLKCNKKHFPKPRPAGRIFSLSTWARSSYVGKFFFETPEVKSIGGDCVCERKPILAGWLAAFEFKHSLDFLFESFVSYRKALSDKIAHLSWCRLVHVGN